MPGKKGMTHNRPRKNTDRSRIWQSMRIMKLFTIPDLCRTSGAGLYNTRKFVRRLHAHGYVAKHGGYTSGRTGSYQGWRIVKDTGPCYPTICEVCGRSVQEPCEPKKE